MLRVYYSKPNAKLIAPRDGDVGYDITTPIDFSIKPWQIYQVSTGIHLNSNGLLAMIVEKSSVAVGSLSKGLRGGVAVRGGIIDPSYRGELIVGLQNLTDTIQMFKKGQKIAQLILLPYMTYPINVVDESNELGETLRGSGGFGSTGTGIGVQE